MVRQPLDLSQFATVYSYMLSVSPAPADDPKEAIEEAKFSRSEPFKTRRAKQIQTVDFPTTTIGSFPQTAGAHHCAPVMTWCELPA